MLVPLMQVHTTIEAQEREHHTSEEQNEVESTLDVIEMRSRLRRSMSEMRCFIRAAMFLLGVWWVFELSLVLQDPDARNLFGRGWLFWIPVANALVLGLLKWRFLTTRGHTDQRETLEGLQEVAKTDPLSVESAVPELRHLARRWSPVSASNRALAQNVLERIEQARGSERTFPIAHEAPGHTGDDLPRSV